MLTKLQKHKRDNSVIPAGCQCGQGGIDLVMWGAPAASSSTLSMFNLCCDGALHFPPLSPAVLKPDLGHRNVQRETTKWISGQMIEDDGEKMEGGGNRRRKVREGSQRRDWEGKLNSLFANCLFFLLGRYITK